MVQKKNPKLFEVFSIKFEPSLRKHRGKGLSAISSSVLAVDKLSDISPLFFTSLLQVVIACFLFHVYSVGVNQLFDVEIDKINKPYLPLASGEYSFGTGVIITISFLILSLGFSWAVGSWPLFWTLFSLVVLTSGYSVNVPLLGWKRHGITATICIALQATLSQIGYFLHMQNHVFKRPTVFPRSQLFAIPFFGLLGIIISQLKDLPDIEGDRKDGVKNLAMLIGLKPVFWTCISLLEIAYGVSIMVGLSSPYLWSKIITMWPQGRSDAGFTFSVPVPDTRHAGGHAIMAAILWYRAKSVDLENSASTYSFYVLIWKLGSAEHLLVPFVR
ncbi:hypothetical protein VNO77_33896 [Canavalia gladiata]|uniref:Uncharacterized protein n=1 Tax=Canavalia gladiata TaxID=3824 RepID=A0AAN9KF61_CANGL